MAERLDRMLDAVDDPGFDFSLYTHPSFFLFSFLSCRYKFKDQISSPNPNQYIVNIDNLSEIEPADVSIPLQEYVPPAMPALQAKHE